jgi:GTP-binding protein
MAESEKFFDRAAIIVKGGDGGDGIVHFRREKYVPLGGPDGGDGGHGGDVCLVVEPTLNTLIGFQRKRDYKAEAGRPGGGNNKTGKSGADLYVPVPPGTVIRDANTGEVIGDLTQPEQTLLVSRGGRGGKGNSRYANSRNQAPRMAEKGEPIEPRRLDLELRLIADVGIVGVPNAGKSTLLAAVSAARPKIANYPFTTLTPNLGVARLDDVTALVLADIPGLIEGAHMGAGLGFEFLRHIQRTRVLIHLLDGLSADPLADLSQINTELALFDENLGRKPQVVALNKMDMPEAQAKWPAVSREVEARGFTILPVSAVTGAGTRELLYRAAQLLAQAPAPVAEEEVPVYRPRFDESEFAITREPDASWRVSGTRIERAAKMTYWEYDEAVARFQRVLETLGIREALEDAGVKAGDTVHIGEYELEWSD